MDVAGGLSERTRFHYTSAYSEWLGARTTAAYELKAWYEEKRLDKEGKHSHAVYVFAQAEGIAEV